MAIVSRKIMLSVLALVLLVGCSASQTGDNSQFNQANLKTLLPGDYVGSNSRGTQYHSIVQLEAPAFGGQVFYHHISTEWMHGPAMFQKIYSFDETGRKMKSTVVLGSGDVLADAQTIEQKLNALTEAQLLRFPDGCQFEWTHTADGFAGSVLPDICSYDSLAFGGMVSPEMEYQLSRCGLTIAEAIYRPDGSPVFPPSAIEARRANSEANSC